MAKTGKSCSHFGSGGLQQKHTSCLEAFPVRHFFSSSLDCQVITAYRNSGAAMRKSKSIQAKTSVSV